MTTREIRRAPLSNDLLELRPRLASLLPLLQKEADWYVSVYFERRATTTYSATLKQTQLSDQATRGVVLRIYDGYTLHEQASDDLEGGALERLAQEFARKVALLSPPSGVLRRLYAAPRWADRLAAPLDPEITTQIPASVGAETPVHFGVSFDRDPLGMGAEAHFQELNGALARLKTVAQGEGLSEAELSYAAVRRTVSVEEAIAIDRESNLSQTLYRGATTLVAMSGSDRAFLRHGGLGGLEVGDFSEAELRTLVQDLVGLKKAERLAPGRYRVIFGPVVAGVLAHEAFGHAQEGDTCARGRSKAWELHQSGQRVGNDHATILNNPAVFQNGTRPGAAWGSYFFDEEGWLAQEQVLLDRGTLKAPMTNLTSALRLGVPRTANGKRESWASGVYTRQTNTYFSPGEDTLESLLAKLGDGFVGTTPAGGMEDPKGMGIQVGIAYLQEVRNGKFTGRIFKGPAGGDIQLTGDVPEVLNSILGKSKIEWDREGADRMRHPMNDAGGCGKYHKEYVNAGCGGTYMLLENVTLG
jgi:TldD protein